MYDDDAVLEFPQSGERFEGVANIREWRSRYPGSVAYDIRRIRGADDIWVAEMTVSYDGGEPRYGVDVLEGLGKEGDVRGEEQDCERGARRGP